MKDQSIDIARGIGIILMVLGHSDLNQGNLGALTPYIYMFHMPLFFIISGYCFKKSHLQSFKQFIWRKIKTLYMPFVKYGIIFLLLHNLFFYLNIYNDQYGYAADVSHVYTLRETILKLFTDILLFRVPEQLIGGFWFLPQLFYASILGWLLIRYLNKPIISIVVLLSLVCFCKIVGFSNIPGTAFGLLSFLSTAFFLVGYYLKYKAYTINNEFLIFVFIVFVYIGSVFFKANMRDFTLSTLLPFFFCSILGTIVILSISRFLSERNELGLNKFLIFTGNHTLEILAWHFLCFKLISLIVIWVENKPIEQLAQYPVLKEQDYPIWWLFYTIAGIIVPLCLVVIKTKIKGNRKI